jgi:regulator of RNase E activity RraA
MGDLEVGRQEALCMDMDRVRRLVEFDTPTVANGLERLGVRDPSFGYTGPDVRCLMPESGPRVGIAVTARMDTTSPGFENPPSKFDSWVRLMVDVAERQGPATPIFAVIESVGLRPRYTVTIGDGMGTVMRLAGAVGFLTNGSIRDIEGVRAVPLPCWAAGVSPMHGVMSWLDVGSPVVIDGATIRTGDVVHADENGALVIPPDVADSVFDEAAAVRADEAKFFARLRTPGITIQEYLKGNG